MIVHPFVAHLVVALIGGAFLLYGAYLPAKAWLAQQLLDAAWQRRLAGESDVRPWPSADGSFCSPARAPDLRFR